MLEVTSCEGFFEDLLLAIGQTVICTLLLGVLDVLSLTPGLSVGVPINSTPAASSASLRAQTVRKLCACGIPVEASTRLIDDKLTPEAAAKSSPDHLIIALAARI